KYEIYDIGNNSLLAAYQLGQVGTDWQFTSLGGFLGSDTTDMLLHNSKTGGFEFYDISNNNINNAGFLGTVGLDWQVMGFGNFSSRGETDMILRNVGVDQTGLDGRLMCNSTSDGPPTIWIVCGTASRSSWPSTQM